MTVEAERPVLRVSHQGVGVDITPGQPWYVGIGADCNVRLPVSGPAESWFVIRHAGVWTVRAVDGQTSMWLDGVAISSERSVRIGTVPMQELRARRGPSDVTLTILVPALTPSYGPPQPQYPPQYPPAYPPAPPPQPPVMEPPIAEARVVEAAVVEAAVVSPVVSPVVDVVVTQSQVAAAVAEPETAPEPEPEPEPEPVSAPVLRQVEAPTERSEPVEWSTGSTPAPPGPTARTSPAPSSETLGTARTTDPGSGGPASLAGPPELGRSALAPPMPPVPQTVQITSVAQFLSLMKDRRWPGFMPLTGAAGRGIVLGRSVAAGSRSAVITPGRDGLPTGEAADRTIYQLLCPGGERFPAGYLLDEGMVINTSGRVFTWSLPLTRNASVIDALPPTLGRSLSRDFQARDLADEHLIPLLQAAFERLES